MQLLALCILLDRLTTFERALSFALSWEAEKAPTISWTLIETILLNAEIISGPILSKTGPRQKVVNWTLLLGINNRQKL